MTGAAGGIDRRYLVLTASRFLPNGLTIPVTGLLLLSRGLSLSDLGLGIAALALMVMVLEIPTGGLADSLGRRPVLLVATALDVVSIAAVLTAHSAAAYMTAMAIQGVYRALESGPLDAWYVDSARAVDPDWHVETGLARGGVAVGLGMAAGGLAAAGLASLPEMGGIDPLALPVAVALALRVVNLLALFLLMTEAARPVGRVAAGVAGTGTVVRTALSMLTASPALLALVAVELSWGAGLMAVEMFTAPRMAELLGDAQRSVAVAGVAAASAWAISALGSGLTGRLRRLVGGGPARLGAVLRIAQGAAVGVAAVVAGPAGLLGGYLAFFLVHGTSNAVHYGMVHPLVSESHRATIISVHSVAARLGALATGLGLGAVAAHAGIPLALGIAAGVLASAAPLYGIAARSEEPSRVHQSSLA